MIKKITPTASDTDIARLLVKEMSPLKSWGNEIFKYNGKIWEPLADN